MCKHVGKGGEKCDKSALVRMKGMVYKTVVRPTMINCLETVSLRENQKAELEVAEVKMLREL